MPPRQQALVLLSRQHMLLWLLLDSLRPLKQRLCCRLSSLHQLQRRQLQQCSFSRVYLFFFWLLLLLLWELLL
jgi:hypothetical protein